MSWLGLELGLGNRLVGMSYVPLSSTSLVIIIINLNSGLVDIWSTWCCYSPSEVKKISDLFSRMFNDPSAKVFAIFLETLPAFVTSHADDIPSDWIYICLSRVFIRVSAEQFSTMLKRLHKVLNAVRWFDIFIHSIFILFNIYIYIYSQ